MRYKRRITDSRGWIRRGAVDDDDAGREALRAVPRYHSRRTTVRMTYCFVPFFFKFHLVSIDARLLRPSIVFKFQSAAG